MTSKLYKELFSDKKKITIVHLDKLSLVKR
jgi:hypothetical protein